MWCEGVRLRLNGEYIEPHTAFASRLTREAEKLQIESTTMAIFERC